MTDLLRSLYRWVCWLAMLANAVGTLVVLGLVLVVNIDVVARGVFHAPFLGAVEVVQFSMVLIVFLQLPDVVRARRLIRSDGLLVLLRRRAPALASGLQRAIDALSCVFMGLVSYAIWPEFIEMLETRDYFGVPGVFTAPWWPIKLVIFLGALLCMILFALRTVLPANLSAQSGSPAIAGKSKSEPLTDSGVPS